jgi:hypothetical protein
LWAVEVAKCSFLYDNWVLEKRGEVLAIIWGGVRHTLAIRQARSASKLVVAEEDRRAPGCLHLFAALIRGAHESCSRSSVGELMEVAAMP